MEGGLEGKGRETCSMARDKTSSLSRSVRCAFCFCAHAPTDGEEGFRSSRHCPKRLIRRDGQRDVFVAEFARRHCLNMDQSARRRKKQRENYVVSAADGRWIRITVIRYRAPRFPRFAYSAIRRDISQRGRESIVERNASGITNGSNV